MSCWFTLWLFSATAFSFSVLSRKQKLTKAGDHAKTDEGGDSRADLGEGIAHLVTDVQLTNRTVQSVLEAHLARYYIC